MKCEQFSFPSSDGKNNIVAYWFLPDEGEPKAIVQISHGMVDYALRYREMAEHLTADGFAVCADDHLGHGQTASSPDDLGFFAESDGVGYVVDDLHALTLQAKQRFPNLPFFLIGHSMGSFLARLYATRFAFELDGLAILGTGGPNPLLPLGRFLARCVRRFHGPRYRSRFIAKLAFAGYNSHLEKNAPNAWITRDEARRKAYDSDPLCGFTFTVQAYLDLFDMVEQSNSKAWFAEYPKELRTLIASGTGDPVGARGQGPTYVAENLKKSGVTRVDLYLYEGARHELFNETNREEFFGDLIGWLNNEPTPEA